MQFIQEQNELREDYIIRKKISPVELIWRNRSTKGILFLIIFAIAVPVLVYYFVVDRGTYPGEETNTCSVDRSYRISCGKSGNVTYDYCSSIHCCFDNSTDSCFHYMPSNYYYYYKKSDNYQRALKKSPFNKDLSPSIALSINEIDVDNVEIILHDVDSDVNAGENVSSKNYNYIVHQNPLYIEVYRNFTDLLLTTAKGPLIISENYWEWSFQLTDQYLFGLGQTLIDVKENSTFTKVIYGNSEDHNTLPIFMAYQNGSYHGLRVKHSGPLEFTVLPSKLVSLKSLSGNKIILQLSIGPTIKEVVTQQRKKTNPVDLGTLGVHICREGALLTLRDILSDYQNEKDMDDGTIEFSYESDCFHENLLMALRNEGQGSRLDQTLDEIGDIIAGGHRFMLSLPPQVAVKSDFYTTTSALDVFYKNHSKVYEGQFLQTKVAYPNFGHTNISHYMDLLKSDLNSYLADHWPSDFILGHNWPTDDSFEMAGPDDFQYLSEALMDGMSSTLQWNVTSEKKIHFLEHNHYGNSYLEQIRSVLDKDAFLMTASHDLDTTDPLIIQNVDISWTNFRKAIITTLYNSLFGYSLTSIPVCGSTSNFNSSHESLCMRWYLMASTAPIFRISSESPRRDPISLIPFSMLAAQEAKRAIDFRYSLQYYFYTLLNDDEPLMRPMFYDFPDEEETFGLVEQYMVGDSLLVAHPTLPDQTLIKVYLPESVATWYEFWGGDPYQHTSKNKGWFTFGLVETDWIMFMPEGSIIPIVEKSPDDTATTLVDLKVALKCATGCTATGSLRLFNDKFIFTSTDTVLTIERLKNSSDYGDSIFILNDVTLYGDNSSVYNGTERIKLLDIEDPLDITYQ